MAENLDTYHEEIVSISKLLLDTQNPRLPDIQTSQRDAIRTIVTAQGEKVIALARDIREKGLNPASLLIVMPSIGEDGKYIVLDGNRRLSALKILETPSLVEDVIGGKNFQKLRHLASGFSKNPIEELPCIVVRDREAADHWIELIHRGEKSGAGLVEWDGQVAARYDARKGSKSPALYVLDFVKENASLSEDTQQKIDAGRFPITNLERLINTPYVRKKLGIELQGDAVVTTFPKEEILKGLSRVVEDLGSGQVTVSKIKSQEQRIDYINGISQTELPQPDTALPTMSSLGVNGVGPGGNAPMQTQKPVGGRLPQVKRYTLIPKSCRLNVKSPRIKKIYDELRRLNIDEFPNAGSVMLRVFLELSIDSYLQQEVGKTEQEVNGLKLSQKLTSSADYLERNNIMTTQQLLPIRTAASGQTLLVASVKTLHAYIHNQHYSPVASELKVTWDNLQPFFEKVWSF